MPGAFQFSKTAALNASACPTVNWAENQAPSSINDSSRAEMAAVACWRDDISGALVTGGTSSAYSITSNQNFDTVANFHGQIICFCPHVTNAAGPVTMTVDGFANLPVRSSPGKELPAGVLIQGTPYTATYNNTDGALYLHSFYGASPYLVPLGAGMDYWFPTTPNSNFAFAQGQAISRTTYAAFFAAVGTTYGVGDGSTTFNIPDKVGRVSAMRDAGSARISSTYFGGNPANLGAVGGLESSTLVNGNLPPYVPAGGVASISNTTVGVTNGVQGTGGVYRPLVEKDFGSFGNSTSAAPTSTSSTFTGTPQGGTSAPVRTVQPTIICNYIIRII